MDYSQLDANINGNLNTGNISTDDFLAIFTSTSETLHDGGPRDGEAGIIGDVERNIQFNGTTTATTAASTNATLIHGTINAVNNVTLNPPLLTVDGQYTLTNILESSLAGAITTLSPANINDSFFYLNSNFYNNSNGVGVGSNVGAGIGAGTGIGINFTGGNYINQTLMSNGSNITEVLWDGRYPSGYTLTHIVIASVIVTILMIIIIVGNMLVIIAIATEKSLKNIQNWFIASLAVADFFLGLVIMPFSLANELMGYWIFGSWWCDIHSAMDVLLCTASIMNLCLISLDRYWSITKAVDYLKSRTPARAAFMIAAVWIMSALICIPPLLGWKVKMPEGPLPKCALSEDIGYVLYSALGSFYIPSCIMVFVYIRIYFAAKARARRGIKKHPRKTNNEKVTSFTTASTKGTIPMPSSSGSGALQMHQQRQIATIETPPNSATMPMQIPTVTCDLASDISTSEAAEMEPQPHPLQIYPNGNSNSTAMANNNKIEMTALTTTSMLGSTNCTKETLKVSTIATSRGALNVPVPPSMADAAQQLATTMASTAPTNSLTDADILSNNNGVEIAATLITTTVTTNAINNSNNNSTITTETLTTLTTASTTINQAKLLNATPNELRVVSPIAGRCRALSVGVDTDMVSEFDPSSSDSGVVSRCAVVKPLKFRLCQPIFGRKSNSEKRRNEAKQAMAAEKAAAKAVNNAAIAAGNRSPSSPKPPADVAKPNELEPAIPKVQKPRDPEKEKRRIARKKEKRATLILGLIMGSFIACWLPFFFLYILLPACGDHCHIPDSAFAIAFWLGYMNSALNPAIYTIFNKDFRRAFRRILFK